jgi:anthranilate synthase/aminodeoxychorismate synthase-like glutamine amidotransferase
MIYIIDHQDSFTWNVVHQFSKFDRVYCSNYFNIDKKKLNQSNTIVLSPGPGSPKDYPETSKIYKKYKGKKKIIGICLGYQQILFNEKGKIVQQKNIFHGYQSKVKVTSESKLFKKNKIFKVGRYHSLKLYEPYKSNGIKITMRCTKSNIPMAIENSENNVYGFQFHPESFLTENGNFIIKKILSS